MSAGQTAETWFRSTEEVKPVARIWPPPLSARAWYPQSMKFSAYLAGSTKVYRYDFDGNSSEEIRDLREARVLSDRQTDLIFRDRGHRSISRPAHVRDREVSPHQTNRHGDVEGLNDSNWFTEGPGNMFTPTPSCASIPKAVHRQHCRP